MIRFLKWWAMFISEIALGTFWALAYISLVVGLWFLFYALVTGFMR